MGEKRKLNYIKRVKCKKLDIKTVKRPLSPCLPSLDSNAGGKKKQSKAVTYMSNGHNETDHVQYYENCTYFLNTLKRGVESSIPTALCP